MFMVLFSVQCKFIEYLVCIRSNDRTQFPSIIIQCRFHSGINMRFISVVKGSIFVGNERE